MRIRREVAQHIGKLLYQKRMSQGMTQEQVGNRAGVSWITILRIENAKSCHLETLELIADALNCDLIIDLKERPSKPPTYHWPESRRGKNESKHIS